jgi:hypothetical protein
MRKLMLIAAMSLLASQADAGGSRSLSLATANANQQTTEQPAKPPAASQQAMQAPATTQPTTATPQPQTAPAATATSPTAGTTPAAAASTGQAKTAVTSKPKHRQPSVEARVLRELHRNGIYW